MKSSNSIDEHHCTLIEKKRLELDIASCDATYDSKEALGRCYYDAKTSSKKREFACKYS